MGNEIIKQLSMEDYLTDEEKIKMNIPIIKDIKKNIENNKNDSKLNEFHTIDNIENLINGYWTVENIRPYIMNYLKERCPNSVLEREFDHVDIMIHGYNIPVEIQRTYLVDGKTPAISNFENVIRKQIDQNINIYNQCWFFCDDRFINYLQCNTNTTSAINLDWFYRLFELDKLKVFTVSFNGDIKELINDDFEFIKNIDEENKELERNKSKIAYNVYTNCKLNTDEINKWYVEFEKRTEVKKREDFTSWLLNRSDEKQKNLGIIKSQGLRRITNINDMLNCRCNDIKLKDTSYAYNLGIIERDCKYIKCIDKYNILQYFPGYIRNKGLWDNLKINAVHFRTFSSIVKGNYFNYMSQNKSLMDY